MMTSPCTTVSIVPIGPFDEEDGVGGRGRDGEGEEEGDSYDGGDEEDGESLLQQNCSEDSRSVFLIPWIIM